MGYPGMSPEQTNFAELIDQRCCRRGNEIAANRHPQDWMFTTCHGFEQRRILPQKLAQRYSVHRRNLAGIWRRFGTRTRPDHDGRHDESGARHEVVQTAEYLAFIDIQCNFFAHFAKRSGYRGFADIESTTGKRPLARMVAQMGGSTGQQQGSHGIPVLMSWQPRQIRTMTGVSHGDCHRRMMGIIHLRSPYGKTCEVVADRIFQFVVTLHGLRVPNPLLWLKYHFILDHPALNDERKALLMALGAVMLWSTVATGFKLGLEILSPLQLLFLGSCVSTVVFVAAAASTGWPKQGFNFREGALFALCNPILYYLVLFQAYDRLPAQIAQPLNYTWAIVLAILAVPILKQKLQRRTIAGIVVSYLGVVVLLSQGRFAGLPQLDWIGVGLALASTLLWALYWLFNARSQTPPVALLATSFLLATPLLAIACALGPGWPELSGQTLFYGSWVGLIEMGITFLLWQKALKLTHHAARLGQLIFLSPFLSLLMIGAVLDESIHATSWLGLAIIVVGLLTTGKSVNAAR